MPKLEDVVGYVVVNTETDEVWSDEVYSNPTGAKTSWAHSQYRRLWPQITTKPKFNDQTKYRVAKVKLVEVVE